MKILIGLLLCMLLPSITNSFAVGQTLDSMANRGVVVTDTSINNKPVSVNLKTKPKHDGLYRFFKRFNSIDTTYITPNYYNYTAMLQESYLSNAYVLRGTNDENKKQRLYLYSKPRLTIGPYIGWHWIFLGYNFDIGRTYTGDKTNQFNISLYSSVIGIDYIYNNNNGDFTLKRTSGFGNENTKKIRNKTFNGMETSVESLNAYYVFNHKHFSYPAAYSQSTVQRKSCGSWKVGFIYSHQKIEFDYTQLPEALLSTDNGGTGIYDELKFNNINYYDYSLNFGYAYNWVCAKNCLYSISLAPAVGYKFSKGQTIDSKSLLFSKHNVNLDVIGRTGFVWNTTRWFAGASAILHGYYYRKSNFSVGNAVAVIKVYFGVNFMPKGHYRRSNPKKFSRW